MATIDFIQNLAENPRETLNTELKDWLDLSNKAHLAKIIKAAIALKNYNGGFLLIGYDDISLKPTQMPSHIDVNTDYKQDDICTLINRYASQPFEVMVHYPLVNGNEVVVIEVPGDIKVPVVTKNKLVSDQDKDLIKYNTLYTRTLKSNNTPSTSESKPDDWPDIIERCFLNREADVAAFIKRHLSNSGIEAIKTLFATPKTEPLLTNKVSDLRKESFKIFEEWANKNQVPDFGFYEVAIKVTGDIKKFSLDDDFLNLIKSSNKNYTGMPSWLVFNDTGNDVYTQAVHQSAWQTTINSLDRNNMGYIEFWRISTNGDLYLLRYLPDDIHESDERPLAKTALDYQLLIIRMSELFLSALDILRNMENYSLNVICDVRFSGMSNRKLENWTSQMYRPQLSSRTNSTDEVFYQFNFQSSTPYSSLGDVLAPMFNELFNHFNGFSVDSNEVQKIIDSLIHRKLTMF